jgi:hypothetical protein
LDLLYREPLRLGDLALEECTVRPTRSKDVSWWQFWTYVRRDDNKEPIYIGVPVLVGGVYTEKGPSGRKTWGLTRADDTTWIITPSIDAIGDKRPDGTQAPSMWHQNVRLVGVPPDARFLKEKI